MASIDVNVGPTELVTKDGKLLEPDDRANVEDVLEGRPSE